MQLTAVMLICAQQGDMSYSLGECLTQDVGGICDTASEALTANESLAVASRTGYQWMSDSTAPDIKGVDILVASMQFLTLSGS